MSDAESREPRGPISAGALWTGVAVLAGILIVGAFVALRIYPFHTYSIPSEAMAPTVIRGDYVVVRLSADPPQRGQLVIFRRVNDGRTVTVKRVIGMPGESVQIKNGQVIVNGKAWARKRLPDATEDIVGFKRPVQQFEETNADGVKYVVNDYGPDGDLDNTPVYAVPQGEYFTMGDNRDNSLDSRVPADAGGGTAPLSHLVGIVVGCWRPTGSCKIR